MTEGLITSVEEANMGVDTSVKLICEKDWSLRKLGSESTPGDKATSHEAHEHDDNLSFQTKLY